MKLVKHLTVDGKAVGLVREHVCLDLSTPGRGDFTVRSTGPLQGLVEFSIKDASQDRFTILFTGFVVQSHTVDAAQQRIFCRELSAVLWGNLPVSIRPATLEDVLGIYARETGLEFVTPDAEYTNALVHSFQSVGNGIHGMDALGKVFAVPDYIWQQRIDGKVFVGSWQDSQWANKPFPIPETAFQDVQVNGTKAMQAIPGLRPGVLLNGQYLTRLEFSEHFMVITCETQLNG